MVPSPDSMVDVSTPQISEYVETSKEIFHFHPRVKYGLRTTGFHKTKANSVYFVDWKQTITCSGLTQLCLYSVGTSFCRSRPSWGHKYIILKENKKCTVYYIILIPNLVKSHNFSNFCTINCKITFVNSRQYHDLNEIELEKKKLENVGRPFTAYWSRDAPPV